MIEDKNICPPSDVFQAKENTSDALMAHLKDTLCHKFAGESKQPRAESSECAKLLNAVLEGIPDIIGVYKADRTILFYNKAGYEFFHRCPESTAGLKCYEMLGRGEVCSNCTTAKVLASKNTVRFEKYVPELNKFMECCGNPVFDDSGELILIVEQLRDITTIKKDLERASRIQKQRLETTFPLPKYGEMEFIYTPAHTVSGDFFHIQKADDHRVLGFLGDVSGKGISAALNISAVKVMLFEAFSLTHDPLEVLNYLNHKLPGHLGEDYVAGCCFLLDFEKKQLKIAGAGINEFIHQQSKQGWDKKIVRGPFLGMFPDSVFEEIALSFDCGDRFYFYTDGFDHILDNQSIVIQCASIDETKALKQYLNGILAGTPALKDDCTWLGIEIKG